MLVNPNELKVGDKYRLTGTAESERERNDKRTFEVMDRCHGEHTGAHLMVKASDGELLEVEIAPWVQVILVPKAEA